MKSLVLILVTILFVSLGWVVIHQISLVPLVDTTDGNLPELLINIVPLAILYVVFVAVVITSAKSLFVKDPRPTPTLLSLKISSVLLFTLITSSLISMTDLHHEKVGSQYAAEIIASDKINRFQNIIRNAEIATKSLDLLVKSKNGEFSDFDEVAEIMLKTSPGITNLQLAKGGVITNIYPLAGHEAAMGHDLLADPARNKEAVEAVVDQRITLAGPFNLIQGGKAVIARNAVVMNGKFWGFTSALMLLDPLLEISSIPSLADLGYDWSISRLHPDTGVINQFSGNINTNTVSSINIEIEVPNAVWRLEMKPKLGWISSTTLWVHSALMMGFISSFIFFIYNILRQPLLLRQLMRKRSKQLLDEKMLLSQAQGISSTGSWKLDLKSGSFSASKEFYSIYQITPVKPGISPYFYDAIHPDDIVKISNIQSKLLAGQSHDVEFRLVVDGAVRWIKETAILQRDNSRSPIGIIGACQDVTEQKQIEQTLKASEERFNLALSGAELGFWDVNLQTGEAIYNERWYQILGYESGELKSNVEQFEGLLHPDDLKLNRHLMTQHFQGITAKYSADLRMKGKNGEWLWIQSVGKVMERDAQGNPIRACGTHRNINEQKLNEQRLKLLSVAIENNPVATLMTSPEAIIEYVNPEFVAMSGYSEKELIGKNSSMLASGNTDHHVYEELWTSLTNKKTWSGELWNKRKNGDLVLESLQITPVLDERNDIINYVAINQDITERRQIEQTVWKQANFDPLTGLANRVHFEELARIAIQRAKRQESYVVFIYIDLDGFKQINDQHGHDAGDSILKEFSQRLKSSVRSTDVASRVGGDEFALVVEGLASIGQVDSLIEAIRQKTIHLPFDVTSWEGELIKVDLEASFGFAIYPNDALTFDDVLMAADKAMYAQKNIET